MKSSIMFVLYFAVGVALANPTQAKPERWAKEVSAFAALDRDNPPAGNAVLFLGSSSIRAWRTLATDFPDIDVINRGFGGSMIADSVRLADILVFPYKPRQIIFYAGDNDIAAGHSPWRVLSDFQQFADKVQEQLPNTRIAFISIKPSPSRWKFKAKIEEANALVKSFCGRSEGLDYIDVYHAMLGSDGQPRADLFLSDNLHMNRRGYQLWTAIVRPHIQNAP